MGQKQVGDETERKEEQMSCRKSFGGRRPDLRVVRGPGFVRGPHRHRPWAARLAPLPLRPALLQEGADALLGVGEGGVEGHDLLSVGVGLLGGHLELSVEGLLADSDDERAGFDYLLRERAGLSLKLVGRDHLVDETFGQGFFGGDELAGEEHLHRLFLAHRAAQGDHRGRAEEAYLHAGGGEARFFCGDDEVAGGGELAAGGGSDAMYLGYHGLGNRLDGLHQLAADVEEVAVEIGVASYHLREVMASAKGGAVGAKDHDLCLAGLADRLEAAYELLHVV